MNTAKEIFEASRAYSAGERQQLLASIKGGVAANASLELMLLMSDISCLSEAEKGELTRLFNEDSPDTPEPSKEEHPAEKEPPVVVKIEKAEETGSTASAVRKKIVREEPVATEPERVQPVDMPQTAPNVASTGGPGKAIGIVLLLLALGAADGYLMYRDSSARSALKEMQTKASAAEESLLQAQQEQQAAERQSAELNEKLNAARSALTDHSDQLAAAQQQVARLDESLNKAKEEVAEKTLAIKRWEVQYERLQAEQEQRRAAASQSLAGLGDGEGDDDDAVEDDSEFGSRSFGPLSNDNIRNFVQQYLAARADGSVTGMNNSFGSTVKYKYSQYKNVSRQVVVNDIVSGWKRWVHRSYSLYGIGLDAASNKVEVIFSFSLSDSAGKRATGYSKEVWVLDSNGKIISWDEKIDKNNVPSLSLGYKTLY